MIYISKYPKRSISAPSLFPYFCSSLKQDSLSKKKLNDMKKIIFPPSEKIIYLKGFDNYTEFHLTDMPKEISSYTLKKHQTAHAHFLRISRAHLINPLFIRKIHDLGRTKAVELCNGEIIVASRRRKEILKTFRD